MVSRMSLLAAPLLALLWTPSAAADPLALRHGEPTEGLVMEAGWPHLSAGWWWRPDRGVALSWRLPAASVEASYGTRWRAELGTGPWCAEAFLAGGLLVPTVEPGLALSATPAAQLARRGDRIDLELGLAAPTELQLLEERRLRAPLLAEAGLGVDLGGLELGLRGGFGAVFSAPGATGFALQGSVWARLPRRASPSGALADPDPVQGLEG
jgi:hypothetical protein